MKYQASDHGANKGGGRRQWSHRPDQGDVARWKRKVVVPAVGLKLEMKKKR